MTSPENTHLVHDYMVQEAVQEANIFVPDESQLTISDDGQEFANSAIYHWQREIGKHLLTYNGVSFGAADDDMQLLTATRLELHTQIEQISITSYRLGLETQGFSVAREHRYGMNLLDDADNDEINKIQPAYGQPGENDWSAFMRVVSDGRRHFETEQSKSKTIKGLERASNRLTAFLARRF